LTDIRGGRLLGFENGAHFLVRDLEALAQPRRSFGCTSSGGDFSILSRFFGHTGLLTAFLILAATEQPTTSRDATQAHSAGRAAR